jgi:parallel beta-helix repeat protein
VQAGPVAENGSGAKLIAMFGGWPRSDARRGAFLFRLTLAVLAMVLSSCSHVAQVPVVTLPPETTEPPVTSSTEIAEILPDGEDSVVVTPEDDFANLVVGSPESTTFVLTPGTHRMVSIEPKDGMTFIGLPGAVMSGARLLDGFQADGKYWRRDGIELLPAAGDGCVSGYEGCLFAQDLFMDSVMLWQVTDLKDLDEGRWFWDGDAIYVANDPTARRVELSVEPYAFLGSADDVTIRDLVVEKYATPAQLGAVQAQDLGDGRRGQRWTISNVEVTGSHGVGIRTGDETVVTGSNVHHNGQLGIAVSGGTDVLIEDTEIAFNNIAGFDWTWEGGGLKATRTHDLVVRNCYSHDNDGPGLWTDIDAIDTLYEDNTVENNSAPGILHEISAAAVIRGNTAEGNGFGKPEWLWGAGILISASHDVEIYDNMVVGNADGIAGIQQERGEGPYGPYVLGNIAVHDNVIEMGGGQTGVVTDSCNVEIFVDGNIVFSSNTYVDVSGRRFAWEGQLLDREGWLTTGQDPDAVWR